MRVGGIKRIVIADGQFAMGLAGTDLDPAHQGIGEFEGTVFHQFGVEPAIGAKIDVLKKSAPHRRIDAGARLAGMDRDGRRGVNGGDNAREGNGKKCSFGF